MINLNHIRASDLLLYFPIAEDNLVQLAEIHENIQRMRMENASSSRLLGLSKTSSGKVAAERLSVIGGGGVCNSSSNRLSSSCPSLNNDESLENSINNNLQGARKNSTVDFTQEIVPIVGTCKDNNWLTHLHVYYRILNGE